MTHLKETETFACHLAAIPDASARHRIQAQLNRLRCGADLSGQTVTKNIRVLHVADHQIYYASSGDSQLLLLCLGHASSQDDDLAGAIKLVDEVLQ